MHGPSLIFQQQIQRLIVPKSWLIPDEDASSVDYDLVR